MALASRIISILLGLAVIVLLLWPVGLPLGSGDAWWAKEGSPPSSKGEVAVSPPAANPPRAKTAPAPPPPAAARQEAPPPDPSAHAVQGTGEEKRHLLAAEKAEAERLAALTSTEEAKQKPKTETKLYRRVKVRDGGTLEAGSIVIRLDGILAGEAEDKCTGAEGETWSCGAAARAALARLIRARAVTCALPKTGEQKTFTTRCTVGGTDLSIWMVRQGWAKPKEPPEPALAEAVAAAKKERAGLWRSAQ